MKRVTVHWRGVVQYVARWNVMITLIKFNLGLEFINGFIKSTKVPGTMLCCEDVAMNS